MLDLILTMTTLACVPQDPTPGIDRELARARRNAIETVDYRLAFELEPDSEVVRGQASVDFTLAETPPAAVVIDFDGEDLAELRVNGTACEQLRRVANHIVIPTDRLRPGQNRFEARFASKIAKTGTPLTRYRDPVDGAEYLYTLVVPADAHRLFPCFDQPDLKARYSLRLTVPQDWLAIGNGEQVTRTELADSERSLIHFTSTEPLPTYLFAFAAGPFTRIDDPKSCGLTRPLRIYCRDSATKDLESELLFRAHRDSLRWLGDYFEIPYPFAKLDLVMVPGFPYGGMEHAGAIFYREAALVFDHAPTASERIRRSTLIYHEVSHQWFGNLVTMEWFDDLWLKEGFATFMGYTLLDVLEPGQNAWLRFHQRVKPRAYAIDATRGTTPVFQKLENLADAKSAYGAIVYNKAPAVLRELHARLGPAAFRRGLQIFLSRHRLANARWEDLAAALDEASGESHAPWSDRWILGRGMPRVHADWHVENGVVESMSVRQEGVQEADQRWPLHLDVLLYDPGGLLRERTVTLIDGQAEVPDVVGTIAPECVLLNPRDVAYGLFTLDQHSRDWVHTNVEKLDDLLLRQVALSALWNTVREADFDPRRWTELALRLLEHERDPVTHAWLLDTLATTCGRYLPEEIGNTVRERTSTLLTPQLRAGLPGLELQTTRFLARQVPSDAVHTLTRGLLDDSLAVPGLELGRRDRFLLAASLLAAGDPQPLAAESERFADQDSSKEIYVAAAAAPDPEVKQRYFDGYLQLGEPPEQWVQDSLTSFHWPGQSALTLRWLAPALDRVEWVKEHRKIFFMPAWIDGFVNAHASPEALGIIERFLEAHPGLPADIRLKVLQSLDSLERAVAIRRRWG